MKLKSLEIVKSLTKNKIPIKLINKSGRNGPVTKLGIKSTSKIEDVMFILISIVTYVYVLNKLF